MESSTGLGDILVPSVSSTGVPPAPVESNINRDQSAGGLHASLDRVAKSLGENPKPGHSSSVGLKIDASKVEGAICKEFQEFASQNKTCWHEKNIYV